MINKITVSLKKLQLKCQIKWSKKGSFMQALASMLASELAASSLRLAVIAKYCYSGFLENCCLASELI